MIDFGQLISQVASRTSRVLTAFRNPVQTATGYTQGLVRGASGGPFLLGNTATVPQPPVTRPSGGGASGFLSGLQRFGQGIVSGASNVIDRFTSALAPVSQRATVQGRGPTAGDRVVEIGLNAVESFVQGLVGRGNRESPRPSEISTGRYASSQDIVGYERSPGLIFPVSAETPPSSRETLVLEREGASLPSSPMVPILLAGGLVVGAALLLRRGK